MTGADLLALANAEQAVEHDPVRLQIEEERRTAGNRLWAAMRLTYSVDVCGSILRGQPVLVARLDPEALRRALRGAPPPPSEFITITDEQLDALNECGPLQLEGRRAV